MPKRDLPAVIDQLVARWPQCFDRTRRRPLKIGIRDDIVRELNGTIDVRDLSLALRWYTNGHGYLEMLAPGVWRIGLDGRPVGEVTAEEAAHAKKLREQRFERFKATTKPKKPAPSTAPKRLSIADLKAAAQQRKQATGAER